MSWVDEKEKYDAIARSIEPAARLTTKDSWLWTALWVVGLVFTVGLLAIKMGRKRFLEEYATTLGPAQGYPSIFGALSKRLLVHECRHTTHCVWLGWLVPVFGWFFGRRVRAWCGLPIYAVLYLLFPVLPVGLNLGRWLFELDAEKTAWRWALRNGYPARSIVKRARDFGGRVCGGQYVWSWLPWGKTVFLNAATDVCFEYMRERPE